ncbi:MAG: UDP-N-acetylmuramate dehydrogenase [Actinomycetota bacterium]
MRLSELTTMRVGGEPREVIDGDVIEEIIEAVTECDDLGRPVVILGEGSNVVCGDDVGDLTVIHIVTRGMVIETLAEHATVIAAAGEDWDHFVTFCAESGASAMAPLSGIPGSVGATPIQNVGAYGVEVAAFIDGVHVWDRSERVARWLTREDCAFGYRTSVFKEHLDRHVILEVRFVLPASGEVVIEHEQLAQALGVTVGSRVPGTRVRESVLALRRSKGMVVDPADPDSISVGSFFVNPTLGDADVARLPAECPRFPAGPGRTKVSAAWLIENAGITRGFTLGTPARVSTKHVLALTNGGGASAADVLTLARHVRATVLDRWSVELQPEPRLIGMSLTG